MKQLVKIILIVGGAGVIAVGSFVLGMFFYANFYDSVQAASLDTSASILPESLSGLQATPMAEEDIPPEFDTFWEAL